MFKRAIKRLLAQRGYAIRKIPQDRDERPGYTLYKYLKHEVKPEWLEACDFIYSNAFDHSFDPEKCLEAWMSCIRQGGLCLLEQTSWNGPGGASERDPFGTDITLMPYLITMWAKGKYGVRKILDTPERQGEAGYSKFIVIQKF